MRSAGKAVLVVEDDADWLDLIRLWLKTAGYRDARFAAGGAQALRLAKARLPDCVVCDLQLADGQGTDVIERLRRLPGAADLPVVMMTSFGAEKARCLRSGADQFVAKSPNGEELLAVLEAVFRRRDLDARLERRGDLAYRPDTREVFLSGRPAGQLTPKAYELFTVLVARGPAPVRREELFRLLDQSDGAGLSRALDILVNRLRKSLAPELRRRIKAVRGLGYIYAG